MNNTTNTPDNNDEIPADALAALGELLETVGGVVDTPADNTPAPIEPAGIDTAAIEAELESADEELVEEAPPVTATALLAELKEKHFRHLVEGKDPAGDISRFETQLAQGVINPIMLARYCGIQPQMVYQAIAKGKLPSVKENNTQKLFVKRADALKWAARYLTAKQNRDAQKAMKEAIEAAGA